MARVFNRWTILLASMLIATGPCASPTPVYAGQRPSKGKILAQTLVEQALAKHPATDEIGISAHTLKGCETIASTDPGDVGEACEKEDLEPLRTGKPYVEKEKDGFDITVPLHDATGKLVGTVGIGFKYKAGQTEAAFLEQARRIGKEMETQIPSKAKLLERVP